MHAIVAYCEVEAYLHSLTLGLSCDVWSASHPVHLSARSPHYLMNTWLGGFHCRSGCFGQQTLSCHTGNRNLTTQFYSSLPSQYTDRAMLAPTSRKTPLKS